MKRRCIECGKEFIGRSDKKYCCDMCRNAHNNKLYRNEKSVVSHVNNRLAANRRILENLYSAGLKTVTRNLLEEEKFDFAYYTSSSKSFFGKTTFHCYEFTYSTDKHKTVKIEKE
jgi:hypothetical protein